MIELIKKRYLRNYLNILRRGASNITIVGLLVITGENMFKNLFILLLLTTTLLMAKDDKTTRILKKSKNAMINFYNKQESKKARAESDIAFTANFSAAHLPFPVAWGGSAYYVINSNWMIGVDYLNSSIPLSLFSFEVGEVQEHDITILARWFIGNSFNMKFGLGQRYLEIRFAKNLYDLASQDYSLIATKISSQFIKLGLGNQWQFKKKYTLSIDWFSINIPVRGNVTTSSARFGKSDEAKSDIRNFENILKYSPSGSIFSFNIGLMF